MKTESTEYYNYLSQKYLPGRGLFLRYIYYPKILKEFKSGNTIWDLGCGTGEFLSFCKRNQRNAKGIDSNKELVSFCQRRGFQVEIDNICELETIPDLSIANALIDNVLEHLTIEEINRFFKIFEKKASNTAKLLCIVPGPKGFKKDPTHKTYIDKNLLTALIKDKKFIVSKQFNHPIPMSFINNFLYLNMQAFVIVKI